MEGFFVDGSLKIKLVSSLEKNFLDEKLEDKKVFNKASMLKNERYSFQIAYIETNSEIFGKRMGTVEIKSDLKSCITLRRVELIPAQLPAYTSIDDNYLRVEPGLFPDELVDIQEGEKLYLVPNQLRSIWVTIEGSDKIKPGVHPIEINFYGEQGELLASDTFMLEIIDAMLPKQDLIVTQWFHCDCLAVEYNVEILGEEHWRIIGNYIKNAVKNGMNMILTPIFTPPLDTAIGGERPTVQLVEIDKIGVNKYKFEFTKLKRWIDMCLEGGIEYFEISHLFTQWGAKHAPKIMGTENGEYKKLFGWETDAASEEYAVFLRFFLTELVEFLKAEGIEEKCYFHISDEPELQHLENYMSAKNIVKDILKEFPIIDALSDYTFYANGSVKNPIPANNHIDKFIENQVPSLWTYYCCAQYQQVSNRFFSMPSLRNRIIATQFYKYNIAGFLHWGYNFWFNQYSRKPINPFHVTDGEFFVPSGDTFVVYPGKDGQPIESLRLVVFYEALQDLRAFKLLESIFDKEFVIKLIEEDTGKPITFKEYPKKDEYLLELREKVNQLIKEKMQK